MRVAIINSRLDSQLNPGGDTVQVAQTKLALDRLGIVTQTLSPENLVGDIDFDVAHVFNIQTPEPAMRAFEVLQKKGLPVILSPIYWDVFGLWYEKAAAEKPLWRMVTKLTGRDNARTIYQRWQMKKAPKTEAWQSQQKLLNQAVRVLPNSKTEANQLKRFFKLDADFLTKVDVIPNGVDLEKYLKQPAPSISFLEKYDLRDFILQVGTINPTKNQLGLIDALYDLPVQIVIIGHTMAAYRDYAEICKARAAQRGNVTFIDHLPNEDLPGIYALAAVHVLPSWRETPGLVSLEAAASGCRIVTTSIGSTRDYFGELAWYCDPYDLRSIRQAVEEALAAPKSSTLRDRVLANYTWQCAGEATLAAYERALKPLHHSEN